MLFTIFCLCQLGRMCHITCGKKYRLSNQNQFQQEVSFRQCPRYVREISKRSFLSTGRPTVDTNPSWKRFSNQKNSETPALCFRVDEKHFWNRAFDNALQTIWKTMASRQYDCDRVFLNHKWLLTGDVYKFFFRSLDAKHLMHFQSDTSVFKFLRRSVDRASVNEVEFKSSRVLIKTFLCMAVGYHFPNIWPCVQ